MKKNIQFESLILMFLLLLTAGCKKAEVRTDPRKTILGKWEIIQKGNWPDMETSIATGYTEYCQDSVIRFFDYKSNQYISNDKYYLSDAIMYIYYKREDGFMVPIEYKYEFFNDNQNLRLDIQAFAITNTCIYKRIK
ncbi:hypothetical protein [Paludibacter jiangxiensis]|uniref:Lipocalin-like domain-containing protein n=1 Tax=Paludibacter jiangxiensis TaxID=681398 RepID=A0A170YM72_9BACT|nr:hypothetical protein [Paludibacter jiangxiensis]GAT61908.1 hypothetical protein PJIAN_1495 [Paludibacter jiangxiensis]